MILKSIIVSEIIIFLNSTNNSITIYFIRR